MPFIPMPDSITVPDMLARDRDPSTWTLQPVTGERLHTLVIGAAHGVALPLAEQTAAAHMIEVPMANSGGGTIVKLRDYQTEAIDAVHDAWARGAKAPLIIMGCGAGKTIVAAEIMARVYVGSGGKSLFIAHREELLTQTMSKVRLVSPDARVGMVQAKNNELGREITVASIQTIGHKSGTRLKALIEQGPYKLVIVDECFPAGTLVGSVPIEQVRAGDLVPSYDEDSGVYCERRVLSVMVSLAPQRLHVAAIGTKKLIATANHPIMTRRGWVPLCEVREGDEVLCETRDVRNRMRPSSVAAAGALLRRVPEGAARCEVAFLDGTMRDVRHTADSLQEARDPGSYQGASLLFCRLFDGSSPEGCVDDDGGNKSQVRVSAHEEAQPHAPRQLQGEDEENASSDRACATHPRRQRHSADPRRADAVRCARAGMDDAVHPAMRDGSAQWLPDALQDRHGERGGDVGGRGGRAFARSPRASEARSQEGGALAWARVDRTSVLERTGAHLHDRLRSEDPCGDGLVYNLEVEETHTYLANGVVVHNCHHATSGTYSRALQTLREANPDMLLLGLTATPARSDGIALDRVFDVVAYEKNLFDLIRDGWLVPPHGFRVDIDIDLDKVESAGGDYVVTQLSKLMNTPHVNRAVVEAWRAYGHDRKCLVYACDVAHSHALAQEFNDAGHPAAALDGTMKKKDRDAVLDRFRQGAIKLLVSCEVLVEGYDDPSAEGIVFARPTQSQTFYIQAIGRSLRLFPGKTEAIIVDCVGNSAKHRPVQLASLAGFDPERKHAGGKGFGGDEDELDDVELPPEQREVTGAKVGDATEVVFNARKPKSQYQWRETTLGWILQIPRVGYYLVAWSDQAKHMATIRFFDQRSGRKHEPPREIVRQPVEFDMAYGLVESEMDRLFRARERRRDDAKGPEDNDQPITSFVDLNDGTDEDVAMPEEELMLKTAGWRENKMSPKQRDLLISLGVKEKTLPGTAGEASDLITIMRVERDMKMRVPATLKQIQYLRYHGLPIGENITKGMAAKAIWTHRKATGS